MNVAYINPFIESVLAFFGKMLECHVERQAPGIARDVSKPAEITAFIGVAGPIRGAVALAFPVVTALALTARMTGVESKVVDDDTCDAVAEAVNIVAGGAKAKLVADDQTPASLGLPTVVRGGDYSVVHPRGCIWIEIPFTSDIGPFSVRVTLEAGSAGGSR